MRKQGRPLVFTFYLLLMIHVYTFFGVLVPPLKRRLGIEFALVWIGIGLALLYNITYNHLLATVVKPGCPADVKVIEALRNEQKQRRNRKEVDQEDDKFEGLSSEVKKLVRYRSKTI